MTFDSSESDDSDGSDEPSELASQHTSTSIAPELMDTVRPPRVETAPWMFDWNAAGSEW